MHSLAASFYASPKPAGYPLMIRLWRWAIFGAVALNSQALFFGVHNPMSIRGFQEGFFVLLLGYVFAIHLPIAAMKQRLPLVDGIILVLIFALWMISPVHAFLQYGQPIHYGLIEDRLCLAMLIYFPVVAALRAGVVRTNELLMCIVVTCFVVLVYTFLIKFHIAPVLYVLERHDAIRSDRMSTGIIYMVLAYFILNAWGRYRYMGIGWQWHILSLGMLLGVIVIGQTRQYIASVLICSMIMVLMNPGIIRSMLIGGITAISFLVIFDLVPYETIENKYLGNFFRENVTVSEKEPVRAGTIRTIFDALENSFFVGHGALSLMWNDGYLRFYGQNFFLADVGIFGTLMRYGWLAPFIIAFFFLFSFGLTKRVQNPILRFTMFYMFLYTVFLLPTQAPFEYRSYYVGLLYALGIGSLYRYQLRNAVMTQFTLPELKDHMPLLSEDDFDD